MESKLTGLTALSEMIDRMIVDIHEASDAAYAHDIRGIASEERVKVLVRQWHIRGCEEPAEDAELIAYLDDHMHYSHEMARFNMGMITAEASRYNCTPYAFCVTGSRSFTYILEGAESSIKMFLKKWYYTPRADDRPNSGVTMYEVASLHQIRNRRKRIKSCG